jgi:general stress protein CsbA
MEKNMAEMERRLWEFIDGISTPVERSTVDELIKSNLEWKKKYEELLGMKELLHSSELEMPSLRFTRNVMEEIAKLHIAPATKTYINKKIIWAITIFFLVMIVGFLIYGFAQMQFTLGSDNTIVKNVDKLDFSRIFSNRYVNILMMVNVIVGLVLLDNYLGRKRKAWRKEA